jgi:hypothetical protein
MAEVVGYPQLPQQLTFTFIDPYRATSRPLQEAGINQLCSLMSLPCTCCSSTTSSWSTCL